ncbi:hypothetical protein AMECASPLE_029883 [Ameca splendens]|uniref:Uncharacterized protein n=1 Tax=Ameca splendens TaxID=208324 RepID=A0ABV0XIV4_9TELE
MSGHAAAQRPAGSTHVLATEAAERVGLAVLVVGAQTAPLRCLPDQLCREASVGHMGPMLHQRSDQYPAELLEEQPPPVPCLKHPPRVGSPPEHEEVVGGHVEDVVKEGRGPAARHPMTAVDSEELVDSFLAGVVVEQDQRLFVPELVRHVAVRS